MRAANRVTFARKTYVGLALIIFLLGLTALREVGALWESIKNTRREYAAVEVLQRRLVLFRDVIEARESGLRDPKNVLSNSKLIYDQINTEYRTEASEPHARQLFFEVSSRLSKLNESSSQVEQFVTYTILTRALIDRMESDMRLSGILGDADVDRIAIALSREFPAVIDNLSKQSSVVMAENEDLRSYATAVPLIVLDGLDRVMSGARQISAAGAMDASAFRRFEALYIALLSNVKSELSDDTSGLRGAYAAADELAQATVHWLKIREAGKVRALELIVGGAALVAFLLVYFAVCTVLSLRHALNTLTAGSIAFSNGNMSARIVMESTDEFALVARNFNQLADDFAAVLQAQANQARDAETRLIEVVKERTVDLQRSNDELSRTLATLKVAQQELIESEKMAALGGLVAGVAHEINTPIGLAYTISTHLQDEYQRVAARHAAGELTQSDFKRFLELSRDALGHATTNLSRAADLIDNFKRIAVDQTSDARRRFDLSRYLADVVSSIQSVLRAGNHQIELRIPNGIELDSYPGALAQVVTNIAINAVVHGFDGRENGRIVIEVGDSVPGICMIRICDNGNGMTAEVVRRVFEPFFTTRRGRGGSGLGLHITYNLVKQKLQGEIRCESAPGVGACFFISLPLVLSDIITIEERRRGLQVV